MRNPPAPSSSTSSALLPLIPLTPLLSCSPETVNTAQALLTAFRTSGFLYLTDYESIISPSLIQEVFERSAAFFARPQAQKDDLAWTTARSNRGYTCMGREKTSQGLTQDDVNKDRKSAGDDLKESFEIGREDEEGCPNRWPAGGEDIDFRETMLGFHEQCRVAHAALMKGIAIGMGLDAGFFDGFVRLGDNTLRLLHYPAVAARGFEGGKRVRAGAHSDYGSITLLFQDQRGGLQVEHPGGGAWLDVEPRPNTIVVNAGDLLALWGNDLIRSTKHRVVQPPFRGTEIEEGHPPRYSVAYFCNPDFDRVIETIPGTWEKEGKKYDAVNSGDYLVRRLTATH